MHKTIANRASFCAVIVALTFASLSAAASEPASPEKKGESQLTVEGIFGPDFRTKSYGGTWHSDQPGYARVDSTDNGKAIVYHDAETGEQTVLVTAKQLVPPGKDAPLEVEAFQFSKDLAFVLIYTNSQRVWRQNTRGDYWVLDRSANLLKQLGGAAAPATLMFAQFSPDSRQVSYVRERNIFLEDLYSGKIAQITKTESEHIINGTFDWVYEEEFGLRNGYRWSPDGRYLAYWQINTTNVPQFMLVNNTDHLYPKTQFFAYPKVGQTNPICRIMIHDFQTGKVRPVTLPGDNRDNYVARMDWTPGEARVVLQQLNRHQNTKRLFLADPLTGDTQQVLVEQDETWVDVNDEMFWYDDGSKFSWISERDGWRHVYVASRDGSSLQLCTPGDFDVIRLLHIDQKDDWLYYLASPDNATQRYLFRCHSDGSGRERLTPPDQPGMHNYRISPDSRWALHDWSTFDTPPSTELVYLSNHLSHRELQKNDKVQERLEALSKVPVEFLQIEINEGVVLDGWCLKPPAMNPAAKYPLFIYVYGEPAGQTVLDQWRGSRNLWHMMLAQQGYVVMSFDNRGTPAPKGRTWRKAIYKQVGVLASQDQAAAVQAVLKERDYLDPNRVGIWGWSGGGSMTLNAMFRYPEIYKTGISIAPVPNQRYYDTIYQERYMSLPEDNTEGYLKGSPIHFAHQLQGNLLLIHGTGDDNCHYQTTEMLMNELIRHNRPFDMMAYPNRTHAIREGENTSRHMFELMTRYLKSNLRSGPSNN